MRAAVLLVILLGLAGCVSTGSSSIDRAKMAQGYFQKGLAYFQEKNLSYAYVEFNRSIQTDSSNKLSYYYLGVISDLQDKPADAIKYYKEAISLDSGFSEAHNSLGAVYSKQQKWNEALKSYKRALENKLYTTPQIPYLNMGRVYMAQKDYANAIESYRDAKRFATQDFIIAELGTALYEAGKIKEAIAEFREAVTLSPQNANLRYSLGLALLKDGNKKAAAVEFRKTAELAPRTELAQKANEYLKITR